MLKQINNIKQTVESPKYKKFKSIEIFLETLQTCGTFHRIAKCLYNTQCATLNHKHKYYNYTTSLKITKNYTPESAEKFQ